MKDIRYEIVLKKKRGKNQQKQMHGDINQKVEAARGIAEDNRDEKT